MRGNDASRSPRRVIETGLPPTVLLDGMRLPKRPRFQGNLASIGQLDSHPANDSCRTRRVSSIGGKHRKDVLTGIEQIGDGRLLNTRQFGAFQGFLAIHGQHKGIVRRHLHGGALDFGITWQIELRAKTNRPLRRLAEAAIMRAPNPRATVETDRLFGVNARLDPFRLPILRIQEPHPPQRRLAPIRSLAVLVPNAHFPMAVRPRRERLAGVFDLDALVARNLSAVPKIALLLGEDFRRRGHEDLISRLLDSSFRFPISSFHFPGKPRLRDIDAKRVFQILAAEVFHLDGVDCNERHQQGRSEGEESFHK